jgi:peptidoglycan/xylan/chitin deacetylase (PgdA/CDA1 family)
MRMNRVCLALLVAMSLLAVNAGSRASAEDPKPKRVPVSQSEIFRGPPDRPYVSLVINAGAGRGNAEEILDVLASRNVRTTFFLLGYWAEQNPEVVRRLQAEGHEIASHGHSVFDLTAVSDA